MPRPLVGVREQGLFAWPVSPRGVSPVQKLRCQPLSLRGLSGSSGKLGRVLLGCRSLGPCPCPSVTPVAQLGLSVALGARAGQRF